MVQFRIADTFTASLSRLRADEQKAVKTTAFDLQVDPSRPGHRLHRVGSARDRNFWSVRAGRDLRIIVHRAGASFLLCFVDHHDEAYRWAERRRLERHPRTGAAQLVEIREMVREEAVPRYTPPEWAPAVEPADLGPKEPVDEQLLFADRTEEELLSYGIPRDWLPEARAATEETVLELAMHLPAEAAEALLALATGGSPEVGAALAADADPFIHPDATRRFRVMADRDELERALAAPWEQWAVFLHPAQRSLVERDHGGPARVAGSAGTGKTIVALHRAVYLAESDSDSRVLLATFSAPLADALRQRLRLLIGNRPRLAERLEVQSMGGLAQRLYELNVGPLQRASEEHQRELLRRAGGEVPNHGFSDRFLHLVTPLRTAKPVGTCAPAQPDSSFARPTRSNGRPGLWKPPGCGPFDSRRRGLGRLEARSRRAPRSVSARCIAPRAWSFAPLPSWPVTTRSCPCRPGSKMSPTKRTWRTSTTRKGICSMWPALAPAIGCWSRESIRPRSSLRIWRTRYGDGSQFGAGLTPGAFLRRLRRQPAGTPAYSG